MKITISEDAAQWYKNELNLKDNTYLRFFARYGGFGGHIPSFSLGVSEQPPLNMHTSTTIKNIVFYIEESDAWYFEDQNLFVTLDENSDEPQFSVES